jgi:hypothetical protein
VAVEDRQKNAMMAHPMEELGYLSLGARELRRPAEPIAGLTADAIAQEELIPRSTMAYILL